VTFVKITASAVCLNVDDVAASVRFLTGHFGFTEEMSADGFASLGRPDAGMNVAFLRRGMEMLPADQRDDHAGGLILAFEVDDLEGELARLRAEGVAITMPLRSEEWGERAFQVRDPNGVIVQLVDWNGPGAKVLRQSPNIRNAAQENGCEYLSLAMSVRWAARNAAARPARSSSRPV